MGDVGAEKIVRAAREWIGTPFHHRACVKGIGCDCLGLVLGVWRNVGGPDLAVPVYAPNWIGIDGSEPLLRGVERHLRPLGGIAPSRGDVVALRMAETAPVAHLGIITHTGDEARFVHAHGRRGVVESALSRHWRGRIAAAFRLPIEDT